jgi:Holliday junction resolvasome RuvABC ATP-dependent DNA helicase subunit
MKQEQRVFFGEKDPWGLSAPTHEERLEKVQGRTSPFSRFVGNEKAVRKLQTAAYKALGQYNHMMRDLAFAIFGPSSAGKTTLARLYAETVGLPFVEISPKAVRGLDDVFKEIKRVLEAEGLPLVEVIRRGHYILPPVVILIDEVHALPDGIVQGLLKATEFNDALMATESGKTINTFNVTWIIATTDEGKLFDAFRTRFSPVVLKYLNKADVAKVVKMSNPDLPDDVVALVAHYNSRITRKALEFARYMRLVKDMQAEMSWVDVARQVASDEGIDEHGMQDVHLKILRALGQGPIARNRITLVAGRKEEEVERFILPWLLTETDDQPALITVTAKGYTITEAGIAELERRGIAHKGSKALAA